jgi:hypothetical protein
MLRRRLGSTALLVALPAAMSTWSRPAAAAPCDLATGQVLYIAGPDSMINILRNIAAELWPENIHIYYKGYPSCLGVQNLVNSAPTTPDPAEVGTPAAHEVSFWPGDPEVEMFCELPFDAADPAEPEIVPDLVLSDVFATTCASYPNGLGSVQDFQGPVLGFGFIVHPDSPAESISAEAAYLVFGFGAESNVVAPWNDPATILHRDPNSGAENVFAKTLALDVTKFAGTSLNSTGVMVNQVAAATGAWPSHRRSLGRTSASSSAARTRSACWPTSTTTRAAATSRTRAPPSRDKRNIRDGHYPIWGAGPPLHARQCLGHPREPGREPLHQPHARHRRAPRSRSDRARHREQPRAPVRDERVPDRRRRRARFVPASPPLRLLFRVAERRNRLPGVLELVAVPERAAQLQLRLLRVLSAKRRPRLVSRSGESCAFALIGRSAVIGRSGAHGRVASPAGFEPA